MIYLYLALYSSTASLADVRDSQMRTPLMLASEGGHAHCTNVLLSYTSSVDLCDINMRSALHRGSILEIAFLVFSIGESFDCILASARGFEDCVSSLLEAKASPTRQDFKGKTALHFAAAGGHVNVLKLLIKHCGLQAVINTMVDAQGFTTLHWV